MEWKKHLLNHSQLNSNEFSGNLSEEGNLKKEKKRRNTILTSTAFWQTLHSFLNNKLATADQYRIYVLVFYRFLEKIIPFGESEIDLPNREGNESAANPHDL